MRCKLCRDQSCPRAHLPAPLPSTPSAWILPAWRPAGAGARTSPAVLLPALSSVGCLPRDLGTPWVCPRDGPRASWVFLQVGSCTLASLQISWDAIPAFSAAWGPALPCAQRWTSAYSMVTASLCPSISPSRANARDHEPCGGQNTCCYGAAFPMPAKSRERHQGNKVWGWSWLASNPSMDWGSGGDRCTLSPHLTWLALPCRSQICGSPLDPRQ